MTLPQERFKNSYKNWRYNPFTAADMAVDKEEDGLYIPSGSPFLVQLLEVPRKNEPTSVSVRCYGVKTDVDQDSALGQKVLYVASTTGFSASDKIVINRGGPREEEGVIDTVQAGVSLTLLVNLTYTHMAAQADDVEKYIEFTEVGTAPTQSQYRVDYPPDDGEGTGLVEFNQNDANKEIRVNYKATGSPALEEFLDTKVSYPAGDPVDNQIVAFVSGAPTWKYNPKPYFHEGSVIYHASGEDRSCLLFRFKRRAEDQKVYLELKGARLHQGYYSELTWHNHGAGTLAGSQPTHQHGAGTLSAVEVASHVHGKGTLEGSQPTHQHAKGTLAIADSIAHNHEKGTLAGSQPGHTHEIGGASASGGGSHTHPITGRSHVHPSEYDTGGDQTGPADGCDSPTGVPSSGHTHNKGTFSALSSGNDAVTIAGNTANNGVHSHSLSGSVAAGGGDAVTIAGITSGGGVHDHSISGSVAAGGDDAVTISGNTANEGVAIKTYPDQLKIYINGVDKTTEVLALTGLTQFGDGTGTHAFVTTGSGEMDISSLVSAAQFHELMITEPISAKGGRCLLHLELY